MNAAAWELVAQDQHFVVVPTSDGLQFQVGSYSDIDIYETGVVTLNRYEAADLWKAIDAWLKGLST